MASVKIQNLTITSRNENSVIIQDLNKPPFQTEKCKLFIYSQDGEHMAFCDKNGVHVVKSEKPQNILWKKDHPATLDFSFSPSSKYLVLWEPVVKNPNNNVAPKNMRIYDWSKDSLVLEILQPNRNDCLPQWSSDEFLCGLQSNNQIIFYENHDFSQIKCRLQQQKLSSFRLSPSPSSPYHLSLYVPGSKGQPSFVRLYRYPRFSGPSDAIGNKSFFKAEKCEMTWNKAGTALLILTSSEVSTDSYYGEQHLHFMSIKQESCLVPRGKEGCVFNVSWNPSSDQFCVVHGTMPAKATLYNLKCEPVFDFGTGYRNLAYYNPHGNILCLAGFGNLKGTVEFWDLEKKRVLSKYDCLDTTFFEWAPDGVHFLAATLSPRLRVNNGYRIMHYSGEVIKELQIDNLFQVAWRPFDFKSFQTPVLKATSQVSTAVATPKPSAYVPPAMRNKQQAAPPKASSHLGGDFEPPSNVKEQENKPMSKSALKHKKKRENRKAKKEAEANAIEGTIEK